MRPKVCGIVQISYLNASISLSISYRHHSLTLTFTLSVAFSAFLIYMAVNLATSSSEAAYLTASVQTLTEDTSQF